MTCGPAADGAGLDAPVLDLLLEQPAPAATTKATPATPTTIPRFTTALLWVAGVVTFSTWPRQTRANATRPHIRRSAGYPFPRIENGIALRGESPSPTDSGTDPRVRN